jgi:hypothetical protein
MRAIVSDESGNFSSVEIGTGPDFTVIASVNLSPGHWVVFATVAFAATGGPRDAIIVQMLFQPSVCLTARQSSPISTSRAATTFWLSSSTRDWCSTVRKFWRSDAGRPRTRSILSRRRLTPLK